MPDFVGDAAMEEAKGGGFEGTGIQPKPEPEQQDSERDDKKNRR